MDSNSLKQEIGQILDRYQIPMDDKGFILEKIEGEIKALSSMVNTRLEEERGKLQGHVNQLANQAKTYVDGTLSKARNAVQNAYALGRKEGLGLGQSGSTPPKEGASWMQIAITVSIVVVAGIFVLREILPKRD